jgi:[glutamine synthetase] adenylyltransferase / [glutamine synthetase]-adenylyl-L-tyrosine phosphorylase
LQPLADRITAAPIPHDEVLSQRYMAELAAKSADPELADLRAASEANPKVGTLLRGIFGCSPYLTSLIIQDPAGLSACLTSAPEQYLGHIGAGLDEGLANARRHDEAMKPLRVAKKRLALVTALADLGGVWRMEEVTAALSDGADMLVGAAVRYLLRGAALRGDLVAAEPDAPEAASGYIVLGMGKYGAHELNYSSDIDLIVFYDPHRARLKSGVEPGTFFVRLTRDLVKLMTERTADGYVFRTDLRLRPDPGATQLALSVGAGLHYYETFGQNWERAAFVKARPVAGDLEAGADFLRELTPYIWRKYLDYAAIADIHAMKRQIHAHKGHAQIAVKGHNLKLGRGGIREIEFFVQTQQLIAGGRQRDLRMRQTLAALDGLAGREWITNEAARELAAAYRFLRTIEHRLQMIADEQTHSLPSDPGKFEQVAHFAGFADGEALSRELMKWLETVQRHYAALFERVPGLSLKTGPGNLVFTGDSDDPATVETLRGMGFSSPSSVISTVRGWHFGRYPAMRSARARERLTEFTPNLLEALARTAQPDLALATFDRFLADLPAGVQLFALLRSNPGLLQLLADIMGTAPRLAQIVSKRPRVMDAVLDPGFLGELPSNGELAELVDSALARARSYEDSLDHARALAQEQGFLVGVGLLSRVVSAERAGCGYTMLADALIQGLTGQVGRLMERQHGRVRGGQICVLGMGKLGGGEMTASSDLDLILIYAFDDASSLSDGLKPMPAPQYYARFTQRLISALSAPTAEGRLYAVDMRLRPSGKAGPLATSLPGFIRYQSQEAWTWEHMALTRARVVAGPPALTQAIESAIAEVLRQPRDREKTASDVRDMRARIELDKGTKDIWEIKHHRGGLVDVEFIAQYLQLVHAHEQPDILDTNTIAALEKLRARGVLAPADADVLLPAAQLFNDLTQILRLCVEGPFRPDGAPDGLKAMLAAAAHLPDFAAVEALLRQRLEQVMDRFTALIV